MPAAMLAHACEDAVEAIVFEEARLLCEVGGGLLRKPRTDDRYVRMLGDLAHLHLLVIHGLAGKKAPFANARAILHCVRSSRSQPGPNRSVSPTHEPESSRIVEHYFVDCDNFAIRVLRRAKLFSVMRSFLLEVAARLDASFMTPSRLKSHRRVHTVHISGRHLGQHSRRNSSVNRTTLSRKPSGRMMRTRGAAPSGGLPTHMKRRRTRLTCRLSLRAGSRGSGPCGGNCRGSGRGSSSEGTTD